MPDYGQELEFGVFLTPSADRIDQLFALTQLAEVSGLDLVTLQDHPYQQSYLDTWTLMSVLAARTTAIRFAPNVISLPLRPPVVLAKSAASLALLAGGRIELGLGAGAFWEAIEAAGGPRRSPGEAVEALGEAIDLMREFWSGGTLRFRGTHYQAVGLRAGPVPPGPIPIWLGAGKPRMLRLTGRTADAWVPSMGYFPPDVLPEMSAIIDGAAEKAGRSPAAVRRIYNINGRFGTGSGLLQGQPADWAEQLAAITLEHGMSTYILASDSADDIRRFALDVAPAVRDLVEAERQTRAAESDPSRPAPLVPDPGGPGETTSEHVRAAATERHPDEVPRRTVEEEAATLPYAASAQHLVDIHDHLRNELAQVHDLLRQVREGHLTVGSARSVINTMTMRQNNWTLGAYCESYCRLVTGHHTLEDRSVFVHLRHSDPALGDVIDRLEAEHVDIHHLLDAFDRALVGLVAQDGTGQAGRDALDAVQASLDQLSESLLAHLATEEDDLLVPIATYGLQ